MMLGFGKKTEFITRRLTAEDSTAASQLHATRFNPAWSYASFYKFLHEPQIFGWSIYATGQPNQMLGFILLRLIADEAEILTILTRQNWEGQGIASQLLRSAMSFLHELKTHSFFLEVDENNLTAIKLYKKFQFKPVTIRKAYYKNGPEQKRSNAIVMCYNFCYIA